MRRRLHRALLEGSQDNCIDEGHCVPAGGLTTDSRPLPLGSITRRRITSGLPEIISLPYLLTTAELMPSSSIFSIMRAILAEMPRILISILSATFAVLFIRLVLRIVSLLARTLNRKREDDDNEDGDRQMNGVVPLGRLE